MRHLKCQVGSCVGPPRFAVMARTADGVSRELCCGRHLAMVVTTRLALAPLGQQVAVGLLGVPTMTEAVTEADRATEAA